MLVTNLRYYYICVERKIVSSPLTCIYISATYGFSSNMMLSAFTCESTAHVVTLYQVSKCVYWYSNLPITFPFSSCKTNPPWCSLTISKYALMWFSEWFQSTSTVNEWMAGMSCSAMWRILYPHSDVHFLQGKDRLGWIWIFQQWPLNCYMCIFQFENFKKDEIAISTAKYKKCWDVKVCICGFIQCEQYILTETVNEK